MPKLGENCNVLVIGAGGIGCELLKNLVYSGFKKISIIDLDTIDVSNLNRQFLFRKEHVGKSKAEVACESVRCFKDDIDLKAYHSSIFSSKFDQAFFEKFDIVFNALDNQAARRHVNRMCVRIGKAIIESGTSGYLGQVEPLLYKDKNAGDSQPCCYECEPRDNDKRSYPTCTIRNTPSEPVHCVVWAKFLFNHLFGAPDIEDEDISPDLNDPESAGSTNEKITKELHSNQPLWERICLNKFSSIEEALAWRLFNTDIKTLLSMTSLWENRPERKQPNVLDVASLVAAAKQHDIDIEMGETGLRDQKKLSLEGWLRLFQTSCCALRHRIGLTEGTKITPLIWDKDDADAMDFVASASIIRAILFHVPDGSNQTLFSMKSLAGNIIPAIATTNAIIAGAMVLQGLNVLHKRIDAVRTVYLHRQPASYGRFLAPCRPVPANPNCLVCSSGPLRELRLVCHPGTLRLCQLRDDVLIKRLGMLSPDVEIDGKGVILISSDEDETKDIEQKTLNDFQLASPVSRLQCDDFRQNMVFYLRIVDAAATTNANTGEKEAVLAAGEWRLFGEWESLIDAAEKEKKEAVTMQTLNREEIDKVSTKRPHPADNGDNEIDDDVEILSTSVVASIGPKSEEPKLKYPRLEGNNNISEYPTTSSAAPGMAVNGDADDDLIILD